MIHRLGLEAQRAGGRALLIHSVSRDQHHAIARCSASNIETLEEACALKQNITRYQLHTVGFHPSRPVHRVQSEYLRGSENRINIAGRVDRK